MPASIDVVAERVFDILKGTNRTLKLFDEFGSKVLDPTKARRFFAEPDNLMISIEKDSDNLQIKFYLSNTVDFKEVEDLGRSLRKTAEQFNTQYDIRRFAKEIRPKDFAFMADPKEVTESQGRRDKMVDSKKIDEAHNPMSGSMRRSIQQWNEARLVIKHTKPVNEDKLGARSRNISKIFIETTEGERFKFPNTHLTGARAMARHIGAGGKFHDKLGEHIVSLSEEFRDLAKVGSYIKRNKTSISEGATELQELSRNRMIHIREDLRQFMSKRGYLNKLAEIKDMKDVPTLNEDDVSENIETLRNALNISEEDTQMMSALSRVIPLLHEKTLEPMETEPQDELGTTFDVETIKRAWGEVGPGHTNRELGDMARDMHAAAELMTTQAFVWSDKFEKSERAKPSQMSPMLKLSWRLGAMAERLDPKTPGQNVLSVILARISDRIDNTESNAKVRVTASQKEIVDQFLKIAPQIGESITEAGYQDWDPADKEAYVDSTVGPEDAGREGVDRGGPYAVVTSYDYEENYGDEEKPHWKQKGGAYKVHARDIPTFADAQVVVVGVENRREAGEIGFDSSMGREYHQEADIIPMTDLEGEYAHQYENADENYPEATKLAEWFEIFDPLKIIKETARLEEEGDGCACGNIVEDCQCPPDCDACDCNRGAQQESEVKKMVNKGLIESVAFEAAVRLANGERTIKEARKAFTKDQLDSIFEMLKENFKEDIIESIFEEEGEKRHPFKERQVFGKPAPSFHLYLIGDKENMQKAFSVLDPITYKRSGPRGGLLTFKGPNVKAGSEQVLKNIGVDFQEDIPRTASKFGVEKLPGFGMEETKVLPGDKGKDFKKDISGKPGSKGRDKGKNIRNTQAELDAEEYYI